MSAPFIPVDLDRVAIVLDSLGEEIEALGQLLCADASIVARHMTHLQALDRVAQYQRALAGVLRAGCLSGAALNLDDLADRLAPSPH